MSPYEMEPDAPYVVTKGSDDGTFEQGDHVRLADDGALVSREGCGWIPAEDVEAASSGMEVKLDVARLQKQRDSLMRQIADIDKVLQREAEAATQPSPKPRSCPFCDQQMKWVEAEQHYACSACDITATFTQIKAGGDGS